jgi:hypothetical protein
LLTSHVLPPKNNNKPKLMVLPPQRHFKVNNYKTDIVLPKTPKATQNKIQKLQFRWRLQAETYYTNNNYDDHSRRARNQASRFEKRKDCKLRAMNRQIGKLETHLKKLLSKQKK